jgi:Domain of unknown function (DUF4145)
MPAYFCPYCQRHSTVLDHDVSSGLHDLNVENKNVILGLSSTFIVCPNAECKQVTLSVALISQFVIAPGRSEKKPSRRWHLLPSSSAKLIPGYVPTQIAADYLEAHEIVNLSPKASATLARRCLQGMIRDFWGISNSRLVDEIAALKEKVDPEVWKAIDGLRKVGNIGAHMEADINLIIEVDPDEAAKIIGLIELLIDEWYVARKNRQDRVAGVIALAEKKTEEKKKP